MADRTVTAKLTLDTTGYTPAAIAASKSTSALAVAQRETAAAAKEAAAAQRATADVSKEASATASAAAKAATAAQREATAATKESAVATSAAAKATTSAEREETAAFAAAAAEREAATKEAVSAAKQEAAATAQAAAAAKENASAAAKEAAAQRDVAIAAKESATAESAAAKEAEAAATKRSEAYSKTGKAMTLMGIGLLAGFAVAEKANMDFEKSMSGIQAVAFTTKDSAETVAHGMDDLRAAALKAGADTAFSAKEAADAEAELVKAGVSVKDVLGGALKGSLDLAAAGQLSVAESATIAANAMNIFGLKGADVAHIADVLASGANKSAADVRELAYGLAQGGLVAKQTGLNLEDTTAALSAFADRGFKGADAGTSLKTMLERLNPTTKAAQQQFDALGISAYDQHGKFVGLENIAGQLHDKMQGLTDQQRNAAMATMFGSDAVRGATVLYELGAKGIKGYQQAVDDQGAAARMAAEQMNNLSGDVEQLKGSLDTALIKTGSGANTVLRDMTQTATELVNAFGKLPAPVQEAVAGFAGGGGAALLLVGGLTSLAGKAASTRNTLSELATTAEGFKGAMGKVGAFMTGPWGLAIAGAAAVIGIFASKQHEAKTEVTDFTAAIKEDGNALDTHTAAAVANELATKGLYTSFEKLGVSQATVTQAALGNKEALVSLADATGTALKSTDDMNKQLDLIGNLSAVQAMSDGLKKQLSAQLQATGAAKEATAASMQQKAAQEFLAASAKELAGADIARTGALRAQVEAAIAKTDIDAADTKVIKGGTAATKDDTSVKDAATAAAHAQTTATKGMTTASRDAGKAVNDHAKANDAATKASHSAAAAAKLNADASATDAAKKKASAAATRDAAAASHAAATASNADTRASDASATAADKAGRAHDAAGKAADAKAKAADKSAKAASDEAAAQKAAAEAAADAAFEHQIGVTALQAWAGAASDAKHSTDKLDDSVGNEVAAMKDAKDKANGLRDALDALNGVHIQAGKAALDVQGKVADLTKAFRDNGKSLDITTEAGRKNMGQVYDLAQAINTHAQAVTEETGSVDAGNKSLQASRDEFDKVLLHAGLTTDQIKHFNDTLLQTPKVVPVAVSLNTEAALSKMKEFRDKAGQLLYVQFGTGAKAAFAHGGRVTGPGTDTSDSVTIAASRDEFVLNAAASRAIGYGNLTRWNAAYGNAGTIVRPQLAASASSAPAVSGGGRDAPVAVFNYLGTQAPSTETQAIMMRQLALAVAR